MQLTSVPVSEFSGCVVCIGGAPLIATPDLNYAISVLVDLIQVIGVFIAIIASLPYMIKFALYYRGGPRVDLLYPGHLNIGNASTKVVEVEVEFIFHDPNPEVLNQLLEDDGSYLVGSNAVRGIGFTLAPKTVLSLGYQLELPVRVRLHRRVHLSEFGCPTFYGDAEFKPIERTLSMDENGDLTETDEEWVKKEYGDTDGIAQITRDDL